MALLLLNFNRTIFKDIGSIDSNYNMNKYEQYYQPLVNAIQYANNNNLKIIWISNGDHMFTGLIELSHYIINTTNDSNIFNNYQLRDLLTDVHNIYIGGGRLNNEIINSLNNNNDINKYNIFVLHDILLFNDKNNISSSENKILKKIGELDNLTLTSTNILLNMWGCNDTSIINLDLTDYTFTELKKQIKFHNMNSQGNPVPRLISIQYMKPENDLFLRPIYRHPNDSEPENVEMCDIVREILYEVEKKTKIYGLNHVLVQLYRDGSDNISSHSDKTLDIDRDRPIINVSIGSEREMTIELKENKFIKQKIPLINNTALIFGLKTNEKWKHEIKKNMNGIVGERISLTFRKINTFVLKNNVLNNNDIILIGQGSPYKIIDDITKINITDEMINKELLFNAFSDENKQSVFDWNLTYGKGFLVY
jgi:alkylated DNA repair dioxygenase AlkB